MRGTVALMLLCSFLWATSFLLMKQIGADLSPLALTALRGTMGALLLAGWLLARGNSIVPRGREWRDWAVLGVLQGLVPNTLTAFALLQITAGLSSLIQATTPLLVAIMAHRLFADERLTAGRAVGVALGFGGMIVLIGPAALTGGGSLAGVAAMVLTAVSYALGNIYVRTIPRPSPTRLAFGQQAFAGLPLLVVMLLVSGTAPFAGATGQVVNLLLLGIFATAVPIVLYMHILGRAGPTLGSMNGYLIPLWTIALGAALLGETPLAGEIVGGVAVLAGLALTATARRR